MSKKKRYSMIFYLSENTWSMSGVSCPDCVDESNYQAWSRYLSKQIDKLLCAETMQAAEFQEEMEAVRRDKEVRLAHQKKLDEAAEVRRRRSCMERPKIDYVPKGLYIDLEDAYAKYFQYATTIGALGEEIDTSSVGKRATRRSVCHCHGIVRTSAVADI